MPLVVLVNKNGDLKESKTDNLELETLCKKAGFRTIKDFKFVNTWITKSSVKIHLYAKDDGRAGQENKYDFPPPVDQTLFFGTCVLAKNDGDLSLNEWEQIYEELFGGFEDIGSEDSEEDDDEGEYETTKAGYKKDGFVVDDDDDDIFECEDELSEEEYL